ncbi:MAG: penicillin-binding transpeptidase domain-containing protein [candidate division WOR-3 bacterium]
MKNVLFFLIPSIFYVIFIIKLFELQILKGEEFSKKAIENHFYTINLKPARGNIYDRNGKILAGNIVNTKIFIVSKEKELIKEYENYIASLNGYYSDIMDYIDFSSISSRRELLKNIIFVPITSRIYPYKELTPHLIGYVNKDGIGVEGFEKVFEDSLRGKEGKIIIPVDVRMNIVDKNKIIYNFPEKGKDYKLTLDIELQMFIDSLVKNYEKSAVIVMKTNGEVLAMYSKPTYNPQIFSRGLTRAEWEYINNPDLAPLLNRAISGLYPPGSIGKVLTTLIALENGWNWKNSMPCYGYTIYGGNVFKDWTVHYHISDIKEALEVSCNVYYYTLGRFVGLVKLTNYLKKLDIFNKKFTFLPQEKISFVPDSSWYMKNYKFIPGGAALNLAIGQGELLLTPIAISMLTGAIANNGKMPYPKFYFGQIIKDTFKLQFSDSVIKTTREAMLQVVKGPRATAGYINWKLYEYGFNINVAGKTGSSENPHSKKTHSLFTLFAPYENPEFIITVVVETAGHGSDVAVPIALEILRWCLLHYYYQ